jgi:hypothetical protein
VQGGFEPLRVSKSIFLSWLKSKVFSMILVVIRRIDSVMLKNWLSSSCPNPSPYQKFELIETTEKSELTAETREYLCSELIKARINLEAFEALAKRLGWAKVEELLRRNVLPTLPNMKRGFFGEILICKILEEFSGYIIPIQKWKYVITKNQSLPGTDAIAVKMKDDLITEVIFIESKLRTSPNANVALEGYRQLQADYSIEIPVMVAFVLSRLQEQKSPLFSAFNSYFLGRLEKTSSEKFYLGLTFDKDVWDDKVLNKLEGEVEKTGYPKLTVNKVCLAGLAHQISKNYKDIGIGEVADDE